MTTNVAFTRREYDENKERWDLIRDCIAGDIAVKKAGVKYLPMPNAADQSTENKERYAAYKGRAVFYNVARRTLEGLVGQVFAADPVIDVDEQMQAMIDDASGTGVSATQVAKQALRDVLAYGRIGLFMDFPVAGAPITRQQILDGEYHPTIVTYNTFQILNWRTRRVKGKQRLSLVTLRETYEVDDGYETKTATQIRVLKLDENDLYVVELHKAETESDSGPFTLSPQDIFQPVDASGQRLDMIPFWFVGAVDNDPHLDESPLYDLCSLNIAHYRNSADYEDSCYMVGQPTPWVSGLTQAWVDKNMNGLLQLGSRGVIPLPQGGAAGLLQVSANAMPKEAMEHKERQMVALGAKLVENRQVQRTLGEAKMESATETSVLSSSAQNISSAATSLFRHAAELFYGIADTSSIWFTLSTDFAISKMSPQERDQLIKEWQAGAVSFSEVREQLRQSGIATLDDEDAKQEIEEEMASKNVALDDITESGTQTGTEPTQE